MDLAGFFVAMLFGPAEVERRRMRRALRSKPRLGAGAVVGGEAVAIGTVQPTGTELDAPLSGRPCVAYRARVYPAGLGGEACERVGCTPFALEREDGTRVTIEATHARFVFPPLPLPADAEERCIEFAIACNVMERARYRATYEEILVLEGMRIAVAGRLVAPDRIAGVIAQPILIGVPF